MLNAAISWARTSLLGSDGSSEKLSANSDDSEEASTWNERIMIPWILTPSCTASGGILSQDEYLWKVRYSMLPSSKVSHYVIPEGFLALSYPATLFDDCLANTRLHLEAKKSYVKAGVKCFGKAAGESLVTLML